MRRKTDAQLTGSKKFSPNSAEFHRLVPRCSSFPLVVGGKNETRVQSASKTIKRWIPPFVNHAPDDVRLASVCVCVCVRQSHRVREEGEGGGKYFVPPGSSPISSDFFPAFTFIMKVDRQRRWFSRKSAYFILPRFPLSVISTFSFKIFISLYALGLY
jgi:hypothetical protein